MSARDSGARSARTCFVCGPANPIGLHLVFRLENGACVSEFTPGENHLGYPGVVHGGMIYSALDDVMANWLYLRGARAYTARCEIRYREPAAPGETLHLMGRPTARRRKFVELEGIATRASDGRGGGHGVGHVCRDRRRGVRGGGGPLAEEPGGACGEPPRRTESGAAPARPHTHGDKRRSK